MWSNKHIKQNRVQGLVWWYAAPKIGKGDWSKLKIKSVGQLTKQVPNTICL